MFTGARVLPCLAFSCLLGFASAAGAQPSQSDRDTARRLALEGVAAANRAEWPAVLDHFEHAERLFHAPIHLQYLAQAYEHTGRLREAATTWRRLSQETLAATAPQLFRDAVDMARRELPRVEGQLGHLLVDVRNPAPDATIDLDGRPLSLGDLSAPVLVDPGPHHVTGHSAGRPNVDRTITVAAGATEHVALVFPPAPVVVIRHEPVYQTHMVYHSNPVRTVGLVVGIAGAAALVGGVLTGVLAGGAFNDLQTACPNRMCATQDQLAMTSHVDSLAGTTNILLIGGGVLAATGVVLFLAGSPRAQSVRVQVGMAGGPGLLLSGSF